MRFARLQLAAFGHFDQRVIELPRGRHHDFHLIFGPNEAGKSTLLRAVTAFLFGIPERTTDAFRHDYPALRVGATLQLADGRQLAAMRRKGRKATLFAADPTTGEEQGGAPLADAEFAALLGGLDQATYQSLYGLDLEALVAGSEALLQGEGEVGRSLFQAAAGLASLRSVAEALDAEAADTFRARASTSSLNKTLREYEEQGRQLRERTVRSAAWEKADEELAYATRLQADLRARLESRRAAQQRLQRIRANLPVLAERTAKQSELAGLAGIPVLPADAAQQRATAQERRRSAVDAAQFAAARLQELEREAAALALSPAVLAQAGAIEHAYHAIAGFRSARDALPALARRRQSLDDGMANLLAQAGMAGRQASALPSPPDATLAARVQSLLEQHDRIELRQQQLDSQLRAEQSAAQRLEQALAELPKLPPAGELEAAADEQAGLDGSESRHQELQQQIAAEHGSWQADARALWPGDPQALLTLTVPVAAVVDGFEQEFGELGRAQLLVDGEASALAREFEERRRELRSLEATGESVTRSDVEQARGARDAAWSGVRQRLDGTAQAARSAAPAAGPAGELADRFEAALREADRLADLLHADAGRAASLALARQRIADAEGASERIRARRAALDGRDSALRERWAALLAPLRQAALTPPAAREWLARHRQLLDRHATLGRLRAQAQALQAALARGRGRLDQALRRCAEPPLADDESVAEALARMRRIIGSAQQTRARRESLSGQLRDRREQLDELHARQRALATERAAWQGYWSGVLERLQLPGDALPAEARVRLDLFERLAGMLAERAACEGEIRQFEAVLEGFRSAVGELAGALDASAAEARQDAVAERLYAELAAARAAAARRQWLDAEIERETLACREAELSARQAERELAALVSQAGCASVEELPRLEAASSRQLVLQQRLHDIDDQLVKANARPLPDIVAEAGSLSLEEVSAQLAAAAGEVEALEQQVEAAGTAQFQARARFDAIDGSAAAADLQQDLSALSARIAGEARRWSRVRLAAAILDRVVRQYRELHQGPLLGEAGSLFRRLTLGSFSGLTVDHQDERQVLLGVRPDHRQVPVGGMSQGTRDQLYLALRLAAIEQHVAGRGPFPVIVDDLLVQFDDDRALAALEILATLGERTQVLFFTHHRHLMDMVAASPLAASIAMQSL